MRVLIKKFNADHCNIMVCVRTYNFRNCILAVAVCGFISDVGTKGWKPGIGVLPFTKRSGALRMVGSAAMRFAM